MTIAMKVLDRLTLLTLNESSIRAGHKQNLGPEHIPAERERFVVNFHFAHDWSGGRDVRMCVVLDLGVRTAWLDVSQAEYDAIPETEMSEFEWEANVCVGTPPWTA
ncbi:MAG: hypothetical protein Q7T05_04430 [Dehalococcoidia bacterium]|nr:hypothetical protein [Dehalococcoidia bacterium]